MVNLYDCRCIYLSAFSQEAAADCTSTHKDTTCWRDVCHWCRKTSPVRTTTQFSPKEHEREREREWERAREEGGREDKKGMVLMTHPQWSLHSLVSSSYAWHYRAGDAASSSRNTSFFVHVCISLPWSWKLYFFLLYILLLFLWMEKRRSFVLTSRIKITCENIVRPSDAGKTSIPRLRIPASPSYPTHALLTPTLSLQPVLLSLQPVSSGLPWGLLTLTDHPPPHLPTFFFSLSLFPTTAWIIQTRSGAAAAAYKPAEHIYTPPL